MFAEGDVLLEFRRPGDPPAELLGEHERVVAEPGRVFRDVGRCHGCRTHDFGGQGQHVDLDVAVVRGDGVRSSAPGHRCFTPSLLE